MLPPGNRKILAKHLLRRYSEPQSTQMTVNTTLLVTAPIKRQVYTRSDIAFPSVPATCAVLFRQVFAWAIESIVTKNLYFILIIKCLCYLSTYMFHNII